MHTCFNFIRYINTIYISKDKEYYENKKRCLGNVIDFSKPTGTPNKKEDESRICKLLNERNGVILLENRNSR